MMWEIGKTNRAVGVGGLCSAGVLHVYDTPEQAAFMLPAHMDGYTKLWEVECPDEGITDGTKRGVREATVIREVTLLELTTEQRVTIAIKVALVSYQDPGFVAWTEAWLTKKDRSVHAAYAAADAARAATNAAAYAVANAAAYAADAAADTDASAAANAAAYAVANAAYAAADAAALPLVTIIHDVLKG
jgi:hypothetical protein